MIVVAVSACAMGLVVAGMRLGESAEEPVGVVVQGTTIIYEFGPTTLTFQIPPIEVLALPALRILAIVTPLCIYLLNRRRDHRRNARP